MARAPKKKGASQGGEKMDKLRERLYARGDGGEKTKRTSLKQSSATNVRDDWEDKPVSSKKTPETQPNDFAKKASAYASSVAAKVQPEKMLDAKVYSKYMPYQNTSRGYRIKILLGGGVFFLIALVLSSVFLLWGNNSISGENIAIDVTGPFAVGGGEEMPIQITIANNNAVPIESATLIIEYPLGTKSADEEGKELFIERRQIDVVDSGEVFNVSAHAIVFGEENAEKTVRVSIEYRVRGSNATFFKEAEPLRFKISSSPVALLVDSVRTITSGQETEIELTIGSNAPTTLHDVIVKADYPFGFDFSSADPSPDSGQDTWVISSLEPEEKQTITITGVVTGGQDDERVFDFSVGVPGERDPFELSSVYTTGTAEIDIEAPFVGVGVTIDGVSSETVTVEQSESVDVRIQFENTMDETLYDGEIEVYLSGNAMSGAEVNAPEGFYDSGSNTITWNSVDTPSLGEIEPGDASTVSFRIRPGGGGAQTPEVSLSITARGQRVYADRVPEELVSTAMRVIRVASAAGLSSEVASEDGPQPPIAGETTTYSLRLVAANGSNDLADAEVTAVLPQYVAWTDNVSGDGSVSFNASTRTLTWNIGSISAKDQAETAVRVDLTPSESQVDQVPTLIETQRLRATDRFTGSVVRATAPALTADDRVRASE